MLTQQRLKALLHYDEREGMFTWLVATNGRRFVGERAGNLNPNGYIQIKVDRVLYRAHRLAWLYMTGVWPPEEQIDHINGIRSDNRWCNMRNVSRAINNQNQRRAPKRNKSTGLLGVSQRNPEAGYQARIRHQRKEKRLGTFPTAEMAHQAYLSAKRSLHPGCTI